MIKRISDFEPRYHVNRPATPTSNMIVQIRKTCDNCYEKHDLCVMSNGIFACKECSVDIETLTKLNPPKEITPRRDRK